MTWDEVKNVFGDGTKVKRHFHSDHLTETSQRFMDPTSGLSRFSGDHILLPIPQFEVDQNEIIDLNNSGY